MATRSFTAADGLSDVPVADSAQGRINRHQLNVVAASTADVVRFAGGWLYDRARAGWTVDVVVVDDGDERPLTILGATLLDMDAATLLGEMPSDGSLAISADVIRTNAGIRAWVLDARTKGVGEVAVWGDHWPAELGRPVHPVAHRVSVAAQAFKRHALAAAAAPDQVAPYETLFDLSADALRPLYRV